MSSTRTPLSMVRVVLSIGLGLVFRAFDIEDWLLDLNYLPSSSSSYESTKLPWRTPSFCAAVSESSSSLLDLDPGWQSSECRMLDELPRKKSKTRSIATLPSTPRTPVPKQTSTPGSGPTITAHSDVHISISNDSVAICRICHEGETHESLLSPCYCAGSVGMLHLSCLERWLGTSNTSRCEICKYEFKVRRIPRSVWDFLQHSRSGSERKNMICDLACFVVLAPLTVLSAYLCLNGVSYYSKWNDRWEVPGLICLTVSLLVIFVIWCTIAVRHHMMILVNWRKQNQVIKIIYLSPVKGKTLLKASPMLDRNENHVQLPPSTRANVSGSRQSTSSHVSRTYSHLSRTPSHVSRSYNVTVSLTPLHAGDASTSYRAAMLRPILRYSTNVEAYSYRSDLENTAASMMHTVTWTSGENTISLTSPLVRTTSSISHSSHVGKETYI
ncbi:E3 ubiquitin-protein ligase MARCHF8-like isoform X2 [Gigantopelta aegis]|uniref:E3 ubiquitin-protein ligase MARCHF8-like isoform X2 n=1 Tax=Gigantopelta aegis TaxID=1735272 RepID=UPI001B8892AD|nr:E3 ubiquitin-protein ligase MARCHF8-like isoform X2 [Gigantopelta aegis]